MFGECQETVSILEALIFGAGDACIMLSTWSLLAAIGAFLVMVVILQVLARRLWRRVMGQTGRSVETDVGDETGTGGDTQSPYQDDPEYHNSAIRSMRR